MSTASPKPLSFDLVTTTLGRSVELSDLLASLEDQVHRSFRLLIVDQNMDDRVTEVLEARKPTFSILHLRSKRGISRGRNAALPHLRADVVAWPDDDCRYPPDLLQNVAERLARSPLDGITGRLVDFDGTPEHGSWRSSGFVLGERTVWYGAVSATVFLRRPLVGRIGPFDEALGLGGRAGDRSSEEMDYLVRAVRLGARIDFDPSLVVEHPPKDEAERWSPGRGMRDGMSMGYILRKHRYPASYISRMLLRPFAGMFVSLARRDLRRARFYRAALAGRLRGLYASRSNSRSVG
jgi:GT2 family glycosyltransferase